MAASRWAGPRQGSDFQNLHRGKRAISLNLKSAEGVAILHKLVQRADVLVENYRPDVKHRLKIDYETLSAINPRLIYGSISGFGQTGPYAGRPGFDQIAQGMGGLMSITGVPGQGPMRVGIPIADLTAGIFCSYGILVALLEREVSGKGQWVQTSLLEAQIFMLDFQNARWLMDGEVPKQAGNNHPTSIPTGVFQTSDGYINIAVAGQRIWERFCQAVEAKEWLEEPDYKTPPLRSKNRDKLNAAIEARIKQASSKHWVEALNKAGVPAGPIYAMDEVFADPRSSISVWSRRSTPACAAIPRWPVSPSLCRARRASCRARRRRPASIPTRCCARSATATPTSPASTSRASSEEGRANRKDAKAQRQ